MFYRLLIVFVLLGNFSNAQLSVVNDGVEDFASDHYIYVKDEVLTVTQDINLQGTDGGIYLRDDAQLVQINESSNNQGDGLLSVFQTGTANTFVYNIWCSPVGDNLGASTGNQNFGLSFLYDPEESIIDDEDRITSTQAYVTTDWNGSTNPMTISSQWIYKYDNGNNTNVTGWIPVGSSSGIAPGQGFIMKGVGSSGEVYDFRGRPNNGTFSIPVATDQVSILGNPYPSALDALAVIHDNTDLIKPPATGGLIDGALYYFAQKSTGSHYQTEYQSCYGYYTISSDGDTETKVPATIYNYDEDGFLDTDDATGETIDNTSDFGRYIPIGQGFMVIGENNGTLLIKNSHRVYAGHQTGSIGTFNKSGNTKKDDGIKSTYSTVSGSYKRFRLNIEFGDLYTRQLVETFHPTNATFGFDYGLEIKTYENSLLKSDAYVGHDQPYIAEALPYNNTLKIPLTMQVEKDLPVRIRIADVQNFDDHQSIFIHDKETDIFVNLRNQSFDVNLTQGSYKDRFEITFASNNIALSTAEANFENFTVFQNNKVSKLNIYNPKALNIKFISLYDISGKLVLNNPIDTAKEKIAVSTKTLSSGVYVAKINTDDNQIYTRKVVINNLR